MGTGSLKLIESCPVLNEALHALWGQADCCPMLSWTPECDCQGKGREEEGREGKRGEEREGKDRNLHTAAGMMKQGSLCGWQSQNWHAA